MATANLRLSHTESVFLNCTCYTSTMALKQTVKKLIPKNVFRKIEPYGHLAEAALLQAKYGFPAKNLRVIGITGTDGKTTTCFMVYQMLKNSGCNVALVSTVSVDYADGRGLQPSPTHMTTASAGQLAILLKKIAKNRPDWVVLETSSHALAQYRVLGVPYSIAVLTNITHEHLDYHGTFKNYQKAKRRLFTLANKNSKGLRLGVINADDGSAELFKSAISNPVMYGINRGELTASEIKLSPNGVTFVAQTKEAPEESYKITLTVPGKFNVYNALAAIAVGKACGLSKEQIEKGLASLKTVPGRMSVLDIKERFDVVVDYAVTPAALENVLKTAQDTYKGNVRLVFGATGDRDKSKRPIMGKVAAKYADVVYLTDDETYTEDPSTIRNAVYKGIEAAGGQNKCKLIEDRELAIKTALTDAKKGDVILITGLGHQKDRNMGGKLITWSDETVVKDVLADLTD